MFKYDSFNICWYFNIYKWDKFIHYHLINAISGSMKYCIILLILVNIKIVGILIFFVGILMVTCRKDFMFNFVRQENL